MPRSTAPVARPIGRRSLTFLREARCYRPWSAEELRTLSGERLQDDEFFRKRDEVLGRWPTGKAVSDLDANVAYVRSLPRERQWVHRMLSAQPVEKPLVMTLTGMTTLEQQRACWQEVRHAGADFLRLCTDVYTRKGQYEKAEAALRQALETGRNTLNGFPLVAYGVGPLRPLLDEFPLPVSATTSQEESPLLPMEIACAAGITSTSAATIQDLMMHHRDYPLEQKIKDSQYRYRLAAYYEERGAPIYVLGAALLSGYEPPGLPLAIAILELLIAARQGPRHFSTCVNMGGNLIQDVAAHRVTRRLTREYLDRHGFPNATLQVGSWDYEGKWPDAEDRAGALLAWMAAISCLSEADWIKTKTVKEAIKVPAAEAQASAVRLTKYITRILRGQRLTESSELQEEEAVIEAEARAIVDATLELGDGDPVPGMLKAVQIGVLDAPYCPWVYAAGKVVTARDHQGAKRYVDPGNLPIPKQVLTYHKRRLRERKKRSGLSDDLAMVIQDVFYLG